MLILAGNELFDWPAGADQPRRIDTGGQQLRRAAVSADGSAIIAITRDNRVLELTDDRPHERAKIEHDVTAVFALPPAPKRILIGTQGAHVYEVGRDSAEMNASFESLDVRPQWSTPWGGPPAVRTLAAIGDDVYADIHVGSIMHSSDAGRTWRPVNDAIHQDVHQVATCPAAPHRVYANTANGVYISDDRGESWTHRRFDGSQRDGRALAVHPSQPDQMLASVSNGPHDGDVDAKLYASHDAGRTWMHITDGFPSQSTGNIDTGHIAFDRDGDAWAVRGAAVYRSADAGQSWHAAGSLAADVQQLVA